MVEVNDRAPPYDADDHTLPAFDADPHPGFGLLAELRDRERPHLVLVVLSERLLGRDLDLPFRANLLSDQFLFKTGKDVAASKADGYRAVFRHLIVDILFLCNLLICGIKNVSTDTPGVSDPDKISFLNCHFHSPWLVGAQQPPAAAFPQRCTAHPCHIVPFH